MYLRAATLVLSEDACSDAIQKIKELKPIKFKQMKRFDYRDLIILYGSESRSVVSSRVRGEDPIIVARAEGLENLY